MPRICIDIDDNGTPGAPSVRTFTTVVGDGAQLDYVVDHNLNTPNVLLQATNVNTGEVLGDFTPTLNSVNRATLRFDSAPATNSVRVLAVGLLNGSGM